MVPQTLELTCRDEIQTAQLGAALGAVAEPGDVVALIGNLGAGKTRLVQGVAESLGVLRCNVTSPTFVLIHEYAGRLPIYHFDAYRLKNVAEFLDLGAEELLFGNGLCLVEWADRVAEVLPPDHMRCEIEIAGESERRFRFTATGPRSVQMLRELHGVTETLRHQ